MPFGRFFEWSMLIQNLPASMHAIWFPSVFLYRGGQPFLACCGSAEVDERGILIKRPWPFKKVSASAVDLGTRRTLGQLTTDG